MKLRPKVRGTTYHGSATLMKEARATLNLQVVRVEVLMCTACKRIVHKTRMSWWWDEEREKIDGPYCDACQHDEED